MGGWPVPNLPAALVGNLSAASYMLSELVEIDGMGHGLPRPRQSGR
jgi:hypothetical protein